MTQEYVELDLCHKKHEGTYSRQLSCARDTACFQPSF
jgi:hypothetical protein